MMNQSNKSRETLNEALDAVIAQKQKGTLTETKKSSIAKQLGDRADELRMLHKDVSVATIALALTQAGCPVSSTSPSPIQNTQEAKLPDAEKLLRQIQLENNSNQPQPKRIATLI
jgi:hypothetical protein